MGFYASLRVPIVSNASVCVLIVPCASLSILKILIASDVSLCVLLGPYGS